VFLKNLLAILALCFEVCARKSDASRVFDSDHNDDGTSDWPVIHIGKRPASSTKVCDSISRDKFISGL
jgi:hypothetical protein